MRDDIDIMERLRRELEPLEARKKKITATWTAHDQERMARGATIETVPPAEVQSAWAAVDREIRAVKARLWAEARPMDALRTEATEAREALLAAGESMDRLRNTLGRYNARARIFGQPQVAIPLADLDAVSDHAARAWAARVESLINPPARRPATERQPLTPPNYAQV